jgi:hypothetical protein
MMDREWGRGRHADNADEEIARVPFAIVLASVVGLWLCYFLLTTARGDLLNLGFEQEILWRRGIACLAGIVITLGLWLVLRLFDPMPLWAKISAALVLSLPVALAIAQANRLIFADMEERVFSRVAEQRGFGVRRSGAGDLLVDIPGAALPAVTRPLSTTDSVTVRADQWLGSKSEQLIELLFGRYFMMLAWCALYLALLTGEKARAAERREGAYRRAAKAAELRSLRYQVNPHFLFNTLNSLSALVLTGKTQAAEKMIQTLSTFYRRSLAEDPTADVPLREEFALQKMYLDIEAVRFPQRLRAEYHLPPALAEARVPGMILQPLVENSVKHAIAPSSSTVTITLSAKAEYGRLVITVADDGDAASRKEEPKDGFGIGLTNVRERLEARFGSEASIVSGKVPGGYVTHLRLPLIGPPEGQV